MSSRSPEADVQTPVVSGSWEDLLSQARALTLSDADAAVAIYTKLIDRLSAMPAKRRAAGNRRLQRILDDALVGLHTHYVMLGQYDEALAAISQSLELLDDESQRAQMRVRAGKVRIQKGEIEAGNAQLLAEATSTGETLQAWADTAVAYAEAGRVDDAAAALDAMARVVAEAAPDDESAGETTRTREAVVAWLRASVAAEIGDAEQAVAHAEAAIALNESYRQRMHALYTRLVRLGRDDLALRYIQRDQVHPMRSGFWHGLVLRHQGRTDDALQTWRSIAEADLTKGTNVDFTEYILSHFALGDARRAGLTYVMEALGRSEAVSWDLVFMAGLGWAVNGNMTNARNSMALARAQFRANALGHQLPGLTWYICGELLEPARREPLAEYFAVRRPNLLAPEIQADQAVA
jgi:tetratricopeptide (TPR) repeat protein